ncbi:ATP-binding protein [Paenibacillus ferrarius]
MGEKIYGNPIFGVRELIQNSIDACMLRLELSKDSQTYEEKYIPKISIIFDQKESRIVIKDNGTGMNDYILNEYFLNIGKSYYKSDDFLLKDYNFKAIGNFGIGFLACFMLSDRVNIKTKYYNESVVHELNIEKNSKYIVYKRGERAAFSHGTEISMDYDFEKNPLQISKLKIKEFVEANFLLDTPFIHVNDLNATEIANTTTKQKLELIAEKTRSGNGTFIDLKPYFNGLTGFIQINLSKTDHYSFRPYDIEFFKDTNEDQQCFLGCYDGVDILKLSTTGIANCVKDNSIFAANFHFVSSDKYYDFNKMLEVLDNEREVFEKKDDYFPYITLLLDRKLDSNDFNRQLIERADGWQHFNKISQQLSKYENKCDFFYVTNSQYKTLRIDTENLNIKLSHSYNYNTIRKLFVKNVFIKDLLFDREFLSHSACKIGSILINSTNPLIQPNVSRNSIENNVEFDIQYAIMKFCHLFALQYYEEDLMKVKQIRHVLKTFFGNKSALLNYQAISEIKYSEVKHKDDIDELLELI